ncbi:hypothetical protein GCM10023189_06860 [Nibrella saemangeumensis]|uniref:Uncharacterized protein n=1 Tax=Nibrella saemangeumensis TaxID=1084526 RepID=A0ABP8MEJ9_9BACT
MNWSAQVDTVGMVHASEMDSLANYQCDNNPFAVQNRKENMALTKPCPTCPWQEIKKTRSTAVIVPEPSPDNPVSSDIGEKDNHAPPVAIKAERYHKDIEDTIS